MTNPSPEFFLAVIAASLTLIVTAFGLVRMLA
jgi:hypothetical protein